MRRPTLSTLRRLLRASGRFAFLALLFGASVALARAGGGQHFSGGGFHGGGGGFGGGGGGSGGGGFLIYLLFNLTFSHPLVMIPLWIVVAFVIVQAQRQRGSVATPREIDTLEEQRLTPRQDVNDGIAELKQADPTFDLDAFFERTKKVFLDIQEAWFLRKLEPVRQYMSDGVYRRFTTLLALMQRDNERNALAGAEVLSARLLEVTRTDSFDCVTVRIHASMKDIDVPATDTDDQARKKAQAARAEEFTELWTFVRRRGAKTKPGWDASQGKCPNCGAPFTGGAANRCEYCHAIVNSGNYDWVLSEITQPSEYLPHDVSAPGLDELRSRDPDAAGEILQDRGLLLFWKWLETWAFLDPKRLQKLASPEALQGLTGDLFNLKQQGRSFMVHIPAVGGTRVAAVEHLDTIDRASIEIRWSAILGARGGEPTPYRSIVTMVRNASAKTDAGAGLSNERCSQCGAPLTDSDSPRCEYCGNDLTAVRTEWQFAGLVPYEQWQRPSFVGRPQNQAFATSSERLRLMRVMVAIVKADGVVEPRELVLLRDCALRWRIGWPVVQKMLDEESDETFADLVPESPAGARAFIEQIVAAAKVDGRIDRRERDLIYRAAAKLGLEESAVDELLA